jgi:ribosomal protein L30/L7E
MNNIAVIRIKGQIGLKKDIIETFKRLNLPKKYSCIILENNEVNKGMVNKVRNFVAFGEINEETLKKLKKSREKKDKKFFGLHPARGGIETKKQFPKGVLGNNKEKINELIERML